MAAQSLLPRIFLLLFLVACSISVSGKKTAIKAKVIGVSDGDTIAILVDGKPLKVRFAHIDCPELKRSQPFGRAAKTFTSDHCFGQSVTVLCNGKTDRYKRIIGVVITEKGENLNKELVRVGLAWHFLKYSTDVSYGFLETAARKQRVGLWADQHPIAPWVWRKMRKSNGTADAVPLKD